VEKIDRIMTRSSKALSYISAGVIFLMMLLVVCDVFLRYVFSAPIKGSYEMVSLLMTMAVFFSFAYAQKTKSLVYMTFFMRKLPRPLPMVVWALTNLLGFGVSLILTVASFQQTVVMRTMATTTASLYIPLYPFYFIMGIAFAGFTLVVFYDAAKAVAALFSKKVAEIVISEWPL